MPSQDALDIHQTAQLSDVTLSALQLIQQPFGPAASDTETFTDDTSLEQLGDVKQALVSGDDLLLILGEAGAGKSVLLHQLGINSGQSIQCFAVKGSPRFSTLNLFAGMLEAFKRKPPESLKEILDELMPCLQTMVARNTLSAIVLDDADQISEAELTQLLSSMLYINSQEETLMRVALAAPPEFEDRIPDLLPEGADLPYSSLTIEGMNGDRAVEYLSFRLEQAGYTGELPFSDQELDDIIGQSGGLPGSLHSAAAGVLNQLFDPMQHPPMDELQSVSKPPLLQSRNAKFGLGALAVLLIAGGLMMFTPDAADEEQRYADNNSTAEPLATSRLGGTDDSDLPADGDIAADTTDVITDDIEEDAPRLRLVEERKVVPFTSEAIESLVPEISQPSRRSTSDTDTSDTADNSADSDASDTQAPSTDSTVVDTETQSASNTTPAATESSDVASPATTPDTTASTNLPANTPSDSLSDADLLSDTQLADAVVDDTVESTPDDSGASNSGNNTAATGTSVANIDETPDVDPEIADILESPTWILVQDSSKITVQMSASRDRPSIESFLKRNRNVLPAPNSIYTFQRRGETWYALLHGLYSSFEEAQSAVEQMPDSAVTDQPWIRNVGRVQDVLKAQ